MEDNKKTVKKNKEEKGGKNKYIELNPKLEERPIFRFKKFLDQKDET